MLESNYEYTFEAEKNSSPGFKPFETIAEALYYMEEGGVLRATCNPLVKDRVRTRTIYMLSEKTIGLSEQEILRKLDDEVEKSLVEPIAIDYGDLKALSLADLIALEGWLERRQEYWAILARDFPGDSLPGEKCLRQLELCAALRNGVALEVSNRISRIFPDFEYELDREYLDFV